MDCRLWHLRLLWTTRIVSASFFCRPLLCRQSPHIRTSTRILGRITPLRRPDQVLKTNRKFQIAPKCCFVLDILILEFLNTFCSFLPLQKLLEIRQQLGLGTLLTFSSP